MNDIVKNVILWLVIALILMSVYQTFDGGSASNKVVYSDFIESVQTRRVQEVTIRGLTIHGVMKDGQRFETAISPYVQDDELMTDLYNNKVTVEFAEIERQSIWSQLLVASFPILLMVGLFIFFMRQMQGGAGGKGGPMSFGKSKAKMLSEDQIKTTFADVAGVDEAKEDVQELVEFLTDPSKFQKLGGRIPRGVLMSGPPGTGKTLLAKAIAGEAKVPFFSISGSDFVEMFVGVGASRVRDMFEQAKKQSPCIIFIDEIDAVGRHRGGGHGGGNDEREQTLNQLLVEMDGFEGNEGVIVIAATNRPDVLDKALLRPGRFDRQVVVGLPDIRGREQILKVHLRKIPMADDVRADVIARATPGFSGAQLANLVNEAALFAARSDLRLVSMEQFELAKDKILMGAERRSAVMSEAEKLNTAYHEAGHAIVGRLMPEHDPVYKVSIIPRGRALGVTMYLPEEDRYSYSRQYIISNLCSLYGGRIAEEITLGPEGVTTGASDDIRRASEMARNMVTKWGLSDKLGPLLYGSSEEDPYSSSGPDTTSGVSGKTRIEIDEEVRAIIDECYQTAKSILEENRDKLDLMASALIKYETLDALQIDDIMVGKMPKPPKSDGDGDGGSSADGSTSEPEVKNVDLDPADDADVDEGHVRDV